MDDKKKEELLSLKKVLKIIRLKASKIDPGESPDFKLILEKKTIGAEITEYHADADQKKGSISRFIYEYDKSIEEIVNEKVQQNASLKNITGAFNFKNLTRPKKEELNIFAEELIKFAAESICKKKNFEETIDLVPADTYPLLKEFLSLIILQKSRFQISWTIIYAEGISFTEEKLMNVIKPKLEKASNYRKVSFNELWLVVVFGVLPSQAITPTWDIENKLKKMNNLNNTIKASGFDKVYLYLSTKDIVYEWPGWIKIESKTS